MDETGVMLSMLGSVKVLVGKDDIRDYRGASAKRQMVSSIECVSADDVSQGQLVSASGDEVLQTPLTLVTPKTTDALASLQSMIEKDAHTLDEKSKQRLQKHVRKIATADKMSFAKCGLLQDQNRFLFQVNNAKARRSTRSVVLGKAKVMSYKDLEEARAKREVKDQAAAMKGKRDQKRKASTAEEAGPSVSKRKAVLPSATQLADATEVSWVAPVAKMY
ncbi:hypothetical protein TUN199_07371 [Pyrenophora tritici-repentis]|nr:hypothetical protein Alg215_08582 [Pyrenophora tritici-repentis]KAI0578751.1 hypothetical protein Alg130_07789 [Pyrenophora tritici-repentis]KAI0608379.1 hypothetical protein TUN205_07384 [Pyrenophora tritici-repentis]KAI0620647.1 hypothetical protein TUN199_07371 [Pyrenophora tritici-repentis]